MSVAMPTSSGSSHVRPQCPRAWTLGVPLLLAPTLWGVTAFCFTASFARVLAAHPAVARVVVQGALGGALAATAWAVVALVGFFEASRQARIWDLWAAASDVTEAMRDAALGKRVTPGMPAVLVRLAVGEPDVTGTADGEHGRERIWQWGTPRWAVRRIVRFRADHVVHVEERAP